MVKKMKIVFPNIREGMPLEKEHIAKRIMNLVALNDPFLFVYLGKYYVE